MTDTLNIIHLTKREDRLKLLLAQLENQNITNYKLWEGEEVKSSRRTGICRSHKKIVQYAKDNNLKRVIIAEDDISFFGKGAWKYFLKSIPKPYDIFFSMVYVGLVDADCRLKSVASGMTMYVVHQNFYDIFLSTPDNEHIDRYITKLHEQYEFYVCPYFVCEQNGTFSDNSLRSCDYRPYLKDRKLFG